MQNVLEILKWYKKNFRDLPWRSTNDPYKIWLSEVILQQTQVIQGLAYYSAFVARYPAVADLAAASEQDVLKLWQGLGYYSRARNLHKTARIITDQYHGEFPKEMASVMSLPGIGAYTAAAILSFAFKQAHPALDGNVYRVLSRLYDLDAPVNDPRSRPVFMALLTEMIKETDPSDFNNAMMELGAMVCKPDKPLCASCPVAVSCMARKAGTVSERPVKKAKAARRKRFFHFLYFSHNGRFYIEKRGAGDIWQHLYQLPLLEVSDFLDVSDLRSAVAGMLQNKPVYDLGKETEYKHLLTHQEISARFTELLMQEKPVFTSPDLIEVQVSGDLNYPVPVLIEKFLLSL